MTLTTHKVPPPKLKSEKGVIANMDEVEVCEVSIQVKGRSDIGVEVEV